MCLNPRHIYWRNSAQEEAPPVSKMGLLLRKWFPVITSPLHSLFKVSQRDKGRVRGSLLFLIPPTYPLCFPSFLAHAALRALQALETRFLAALPRILGLTFALPHWWLHHCLRHSGKTQAPPTPRPQPPSDTTSPTAHTLQTPPAALPPRPQPPQWYNRAHGPHPSDAPGVSATANGTGALHLGLHAASSGAPSSEDLACNPSPTSNQGPQASNVQSGDWCQAPSPAFWRGRWGLPAILMPKSSWITGNAISPIHKDTSVRFLYWFWFDFGFWVTLSVVSSMSVFGWIKQFSSMYGMLSKQDTRIFFFFLN